MWRVFANKGGIVHKCKRNPLLSIDTPWSVHGDRNKRNI